jgi:hypothetical protein
MHLPRIHRNKPHLIRTGRCSFLRLRDDTYDTDAKGKGMTLPLLPNRERSNRSQGCAGNTLSDQFGTALALIPIEFRKATTGLCLASRPRQR